MVRSVASARDFDGLFKKLLEAHPREALQQLCGARVDGGTVVVDGPTEQPRQRSLQLDKVFVVRRGGGVPADIYHVEVQVKRTDDFQERMVSYWASLALRYRRAEHRIHQVVLWPLGGGYPGRFRRDRVQLDYRSVSVPDDLEPGVLLAGPLAPLALWSQKPPVDVVERVVDRIAATVAVEEQLVLVELGMLASGSLAAQVLEALRRRGMNNVLEQSEAGREIARKNREEERVDSMRALLRAKYGEFDDLDELARKLAGRDKVGTMARIVAGASLAELRS
ncbi:hypothetical protein C8E87_7640 [Paractinoplanes brasiliensis]|uniref:Uncharacterized protein n=1 Tax=Paractinoplanes brasiliensis TaxID=52695 RepID=A0A4R6J9M8_9ACTN|nr:hypothetical protein C8E87_7640 [Actinoplanes brasiliensis]GID28245.1 hypothetical protein Abr02nite_32280 [Actinoplanes brasiliensis]